jgi:hypothetical protein
MKTEFANNLMYNLKMLEKGMYMELVFHTDASKFTELDATEEFRYSTLIGLNFTFQSLTEIFLKMIDNDRLCLFFDEYKSEIYGNLEKIKRYINELQDEEYETLYKRLYNAVVTYNLAYDEKQNSFAAKMEEFKGEMGENNFEKLMDVFVKMASKNN